MNKSTSYLLYVLFGPNGQNQTIARCQTQTMNAAQELERHGIIKVIDIDSPNVPGGFVLLKRVCKTLDS